MDNESNDDTSYYVDISFSYSFRIWLLLSIDY